MMTEHLSTAIKYLHENNLTCVLYNGEVFHSSTLRGVAPIVEFINQYGTLEGFCAADKVVGKAAALLYVKMKVSSVYADVMSDDAVCIFEKYGIPFTFANRCKHIINRKKDGLCPMEKTTENIDSPDEAFLAICEKLRQLKENKT